MSLHDFGVDWMNIAKGVAGTLASAGTGGAVSSSAFGQKKAGGDKSAASLPPPAPAPVSTARIALYVGGGIAALGIIVGLVRR